MSWQRHRDAITRMQLLHLTFSFYESRNVHPREPIGATHFTLDLSVELTTDSRNDGTDERNGIGILSRRKLKRLHFVARLQMLFKLTQKHRAAPDFLL